MVQARGWAHAHGMYTLQIEHPISDYSVWKGAFDRFADVRKGAGVRGHAVRRPVDDERYVVVDLMFDTAEGAADFREVLRTRIWAIPANSPALAGEPVTRILVREEDRLG